MNISVQRTVNIMPDKGIEQEKSIRSPGFSRSDTLPTFSTFIPSAGLSFLCPVVHDVGVCTLQQPGQEQRRRERRKNRIRITELWVVK